jgi:hypothetical protein
MSQSVPIVLQVEISCVRDYFWYLLKKIVIGFWSLQLSVTNISQNNYNLRKA